MSAIEGDTTMACLFDRQDMKLVNIKFFRGSAEVIGEDDLWSESHSAVMQYLMEPHKARKEPPDIEMEPIDVREFVDKL
jgi:hypothetical protein